MSYIGNTQQNPNYFPAVDFFSGNGSTTAFTLTRPVASVAAIQAIVSNVAQNPSDAYTVSGNTITFTSAPPSGTNNIYVYYTSPNTQVVQPGQGTVNTAQLGNVTNIPSTGAMTLTTQGGAYIATLPTETGTLLTTNSTGYRLAQTLQYTSTGTFSKASYPWLRGIRVRCVGGGGGGGGVSATGAGAFATGGGGGGGGYAESFITDIAGLASSVTVTVGTGGAGGVAGANAGSIGNNSSFGSLVIGNGGYGGGGQTAQNFWITTAPGVGGSGTGTLVIAGGSGGYGNPVNSNGGYGGIGGNTVLGLAATPRAAWQSSADGTVGALYGTGGSGAASGQNSVARAGGAGAAGIVILELFA